MSKRTRGTARTPHRRPGTRPTPARSARQRDTASRQRDLDEALLLDEAIEVEALGVPDEAPATRTETSRSEPAAVRPPRGSRAHQRVKAGSLLAARASTEYVYVAQDLKRIVVVGGLLFGALIVLWLLIVVMRVIPLPFY